MFYTISRLKHDFLSLIVQGRTSIILCGSSARTSLGLLLWYSVAVVSKIILTQLSQDAPCIVVFLLALPAMFEA